MSSIAVYDAASDIAENIANSKTMPGKEKYDLQTKINNNLRQEEHIEVFKILIRDGSKYTTNTSGTYFDLNDLENKTLWKIRQYLDLTMDKLSREKVIEQAEREKKIAELQLANRFAKEQQGDIEQPPRIINEPLTPYTAANVPSYAELRTQALYDTVPSNNQQRAHALANMQPETQFGTEVRSDYGAPGPGETCSTFVSSGICITDEDLNTETEIGISEVGDDDDGESIIYDDPSDMILNGGQESRIKQEYEFEIAAGNVDENDC